MKHVIISVLFCCIISPVVFSQSKTVAEFAKEADGYKIYLYQSVIRLLNVDKNDDFNMLIRNLDHIRYLSTDSTDDEAYQKFLELDNSVNSEGFEEILTFDNKDYKCHVYELNSKKNRATWVAVLLIDGRAGILEMKGSLDLKYLKAFSSFDMDRFQTLVPSLQF